MQRIGVRYALAPQPVNPEPKPIPEGKVRTVKGRSYTQVYHTDPYCDKLRDNHRDVKLGYAKASGLRLCSTCGQPQRRLTHFTPTNLAVPA